MNDAIKIHKLDFATVEFYENFVVNVINAEVNFDLPHVRLLSDIFDNHFEGKGYTYISHRINDYSLNPMIYPKLVEFTNLKGIGIVSDNFTRLQVANFEKQFSPIPFELFHTIEEAKAWASSFFID